jgi:hypothetical protein
MGGWTDLSLVFTHQLAQIPAGRATARGTLQADEAPALPHTFVTTPSSMESTSIQTAERLPPISGPRPTRVQPRSSAALRNHNRMDELLRREPAGFSAALPGSLCKGLERHGIDEALTHQALQADWGATSDRCAVLAGVVAPRPGGLTPVGCCPNWWVSSAPGCNGFRSLAFDRSKGGRSGHPPVDSAHKKMVLRWGADVRPFLQQGCLAVIQKVNGAKRIRTADPLHAMQVLYQLSYGPIGLTPMLESPAVLPRKAYTAG